MWVELRTCPFKKKGQGKFPWFPRFPCSGTRSHPESSCHPGIPRQHSWSVGDQDLLQKLDLSGWFHGNLWIISSSNMIQTSSKHHDLTWSDMIWDDLRCQWNINENIMTPRVLWGWHLWSWPSRWCDFSEWPSCATSLPQICSIPSRSTCLFWDTLDTIRFHICVYI